MATAKKTRKAAPKKKTAAKKKIKLACTECGVILSVDKTCGCMEAHDIICCGKPMKKK